MITVVSSGSLPRNDSAGTTMLHSLLRIVRDSIHPAGNDFNYSDPNAHQLAHLRSPPFRLTCESF
jgi:hypothetical protein